MTTIDGSRITSHTWAVVVLWFAALNVLDLGLTLHLINQGAVEMNPIMSALLDTGFEWAAGFKVFTTAGVAAGLWLGRRHLMVRRTGIAFVAFFAVLITYQVFDVWAAG
ncbi:MAG TPA: DUF5658 family protein [Acidimicrobiia bacterium]|nr:DUF5658 family protein [Acidimicrobiia bacterium]